MSLNRKNFLKKVCVSGACMCGFSSIAFSDKENENFDPATGLQENNQTMIRDWISNLVSNLNGEFNENEIKNVLKKCSVIHYDNLKMDEILFSYINDLESFIDFLEEKWNWKIDFDEITKTLIADENKNHCVCPIINYTKGVDTSAICYCSEGFAEKMFSAVSGTSVSATVISSIRRGEERCKYKIVFA
jgi:hypothetical protein